MIYVLIIVALFAALSLTLARQTDTTEAGQLTSQEVEIYATQIMEAPTAVKQALDQMLWTGSAISTPAAIALDFVEPGDEPNYSTPTHIHKVYHPRGGGLLKPHFPDKVYNQVSTPPDAGVYIGRFNNVEWTETTGQDVIFTVYQIDQTLCAEINERLTGSTAIPALDAGMATYLVDPAFHGGGASDLNAANCAACEGQVQLCVSDNTVSAYSFYSIVASQ